MNDAASTPATLPDVHAAARRSPSVTLAEHERQPDMKRMRAYRLARVQAELRRHDYAGGFFCDPFNVRYATGTRNMAVWTAHVPARYCFVPAEGKTILFEFRSSQHLAEGIETVGECRPFIGWYYMTTGVRQVEKAKAFARQSQPWSTITAVAIAASRSTAWIRWASTSFAPRASKSSRARRSCSMRVRSSPRTRSRE